MALALISAFAHAAFGALQKGRYDPWLMRGAIDAAIAVMAAPIAFFVVPWPEGWVWGLLAGAMLIHFVYKWLMAMAYTRGAYTAVYPIVRGTGPLATIFVASLVFSEQYAAMQWFGVALLSGGILALAAWNLAQETAPVARTRLFHAVGLAVLTGLLVALYTVWDAWGIRSTPDPFTFLAWFFLLTSLDFPVISFLHWRAMPERPHAGPLIRRGFLGGLIAFVSFGGVMLATRLDKVGEAAVLRETSVVFAALIGWLALGETIGPRRLLMMASIALGAVLVEFG